MIALASGLIRRFAGPLVLLLTAILLVLVLGLVWRGRGERDEALAGARDRAAAATAAAGETASAAATEAVAALGERQAGRTAHEQETRDEILSTPDARASAGAAGHAGLVGLCRRSAYRDHPRCAGLRRTDSAPVAR